MRYEQANGSSSQSCEEKKNQLYFLKGCFVLRLYCAVKRPHPHIFPATYMLQQLSRANEGSSVTPPLLHTFQTNIASCFFFVLSLSVPFTLTPHHKRCVMVLSGPFAAPPHWPCRFMCPGRLTLSGGSCAAQIIYPSATAPRPTGGEPESRPSVYGPAHQ